MEIKKNIQYWYSIPVLYNFMTFSSVCLDQVELKVIIFVFVLFSRKEQNMTQEAAVL